MRDFRVGDRIQRPASKLTTSEFGTVWAVTTRSLVVRWDGAKQDTIVSRKLVKQWERARQEARKALGL